MSNPSASLIQRLAMLDDDAAISAFSRILAERSQDRDVLVRSFRSDLPDLYGKWLAQQALGRNTLR
jgi:hypothetical protein